MSKKVTESDLELIQLGKSLGLDLVSFADLRASQEDNFVDIVREKALYRMQEKKDNYLHRDDYFYAGSIDFMVSNEPEGKTFFLLETNGGSHRGLSILSKKQQSILYDGYLEAISQAIINNKREDNKIFVLVGVPINDGLIHEKIILIEYLRKKLKEKHQSVKIFNVDNFDRTFKAEVVFLIADYKQLAANLSFSQNWVIYDGEKVNVLIGDGIARRLNNYKFINLIKKNIRKLKTIIVNPIFLITDDKSLTYLASYYNKKELAKYNLKYLLFTKAYNEEDLMSKIEFLLREYKQSFIIKPSGGSGGAGVMPVSEFEEPSNIRKIIQESKKEFFAKFMKIRNPFPYTIQEKADFSLIDWKGGKHTFDLRIYLAQNKKKVIPIGGLVRISRDNFINGLNKQEFVVNLSGYNGQIEVERGIGFSRKSCEILNLTSEDFINMFCIGCVLFKGMVQNYEKIIKFSNWDKILV
ncbi:MAG: hypothetical protein ACXACC_04180 [Promethearchaeota archaeon]|jgi:hypothetical protein